MRERVRESRETEHFNVRKYIVVGGGVSDSIIIIIDIIILKYILRERERKRKNVKT